MTRKLLELVKIKEYRKSAKNSEEVGRRRRKKSRFRAFALAISIICGL